MVNPTKAYRSIPFGKLSVFPMAKFDALDGNTDRLVLLRLGSLGSTVSRTMYTYERARAYRYAASKR